MENNDYNISQGKWFINGVKEEGIDVAEFKKVFGHEEAINRVTKVSNNYFFVLESEELLPPMKVKDIKKRFSDVLHTDKIIILDGGLKLAAILSKDDKKE